ncbi:hypothetical protein BC826DRAFT_985682 [Russula brevipes]|nr:hypothetical protein BC826DRAFT_985682 [Russula brevipes]
MGRVSTSVADERDSLPHLRQPLGRPPRGEKHGRIEPERCFPTLAPPGTPMGDRKYIMTVGRPATNAAEQNANDDPRVGLSKPKKLGRIYANSMATL